jgi:hypothetical protein
VDVRQSGSGSRLHVRYVNRVTSHRLYPCNDAGEVGAPVRDRHDLGARLPRDTRESQTGVAPRSTCRLALPSWHERAKRVRFCQTQLIGSHCRTEGSHECRSE